MKTRSSGWVVLLWLALAGLVAAGCGSSLTPGVFATFSGGEIDLGSSSADYCKMTISGSSSINSSTYVHASKSDCGVTTSGEGVDTLSLPTFLASTSSVDVTIQNSAYIKIGTTAYQPSGTSWCKNGNSSNCYSGSAGITLPSINSTTQPYVLFNNASANQFDEITSEVSNYPLYFKYSSSGSPYRINSITLKNSSTLILEPGTYYITQLISSGTFYIKVNTTDSSGNALGDGSGTVKLYLYNSPETTFQNGNSSCINIQNCGSTITSADSEYPERLQIWVYKNDLKLPYSQGSIQVAASIYVADGDLIFNTNSGSAFIGEAVAENVSVYNEPAYFIYKDTGAFASLYSSTSSYQEGEYSLAASATPSSASTGDLVYIPYQTDYYEQSDGSYSYISGHLKAFAYQSDGTTSSTASWDADDEMTVADRTAKLWSTDSSGNLLLFSALDDSAFSLASGSALSVATIKAYTLDPAYNSEAYLGYRDPDGLIGRPYTSRPVIMGAIVLFQTDDGFLYAVDAESGALRWGYMPRPLVAGLQNYSSFYTTHPMEGQIAILTADDTSTEGYIVGSANGGALHYALQVDEDGNLVDQLWLDETAGSNPHKPLVFSAGTKNWAVYVGASDEVVARTLDSSYTEKRFDVSKYLDTDARLTATPMGLGEYSVSGSSSQLDLTLFVGDSAGDIYYGSLVSSNSMVSSFKLTALGNIGTSTGVTDEVLFLEHATRNGVGYVTAQSSSRLKTFRYPEDDAAWFQNWTSYTGGSGYWDDTGKTYTAETVFTPNTEHVQKLPSSGATITDKVTIAAGVVFLPVKVETDDSCEAWYYLYQLADGYFPDNTLYFTSSVTDNVLIGTGSAYTPSITVLNGSVVLEGNSEQNSSDGTVTQGLDDPFTFTSGPGGRSGWRELRNE